MLVIREAQIAALQADMVARFDRSLAAQLRQFAPHDAQALGGDGLLAVVRLGRHRAGESGFTNRDSIRLYTELMMLLGSGFATDPQYPWAAQTGRKTAAALHFSAIHYIRTVLGPKREFAMRALERIVNHRLRDFLDGGIVHMLNVIFPEKCLHAGEDGLRALVESARTVAARNGLAGAAAPVLLTLVMFFLGHEADQDPANPWVQRVLCETASMQPPLRIQALENKVWEEFRNGLGQFI